MQDKILISDEKLILLKCGKVKVIGNDSKKIKIIFTKKLRNACCH
jgi:hypothetical protein